MLRPLCHEAQLLLHQALRSQLRVGVGLQQRKVSHHLCRDCQRQFSTTRKYIKKIQGTWSQTLANLERQLSSSTGSKDGPSEPGSSQPKMAAPAAGAQTPLSSPKSPDGSGDTKSSQSQKVLKVTPRARKKSIDYSYTGNIYILPVRAMNEYLLKPSDLDELPKYSRRSPYETGPKIVVYLRSDVEDLAGRVWGSLDKLNKEKHKLLQGDRYDVFEMRRLIDQHKLRVAAMSEDRPPTDKNYTVREIFLESGTGRVVMSAIFVNALNSLIKLVAWIFTGSHSMFSEVIHSVADTVNQVILAFGLYHSMQKPDSDHPYGFVNLRHISSLISGVGIFCLGSGLSCYHGIQGFLHPEQLGSMYWALGTLAAAFVSEGATLLVAVNQVRKKSRAKNMRFWQYVQGGFDPNVNVVLLEDLAAVVGVGIAAACMGITHYTGNPFADSLGSMLIGGLLGVVATFIITTNTEALVGRSIPQTLKQQISQDLESDRMIRSLHDVKATDMAGQVRFKAEVDFDGREITRAYLYKLDLEQLLAEMRELQKVEDVEGFMLNHGEKIIDLLGEEVDRIEKKLKKTHPQLRHVDLEAL
ncbi:proton-coupled zinc antiporter SLC30A9, mitochondrial-like [Haliotis cracherodii]|uniref:proton-coupled zinc antiporter SLC30A9, mitochondrial-like n=1 Tax=Haliotis cracherodii TaxID=6455 RepID=UPI001EB07A7E